ncbi:hypothetical protein BX611_2971 [Lutibacter oceani]|uniref:Nucleotidyltransferase AbiEii toxin of type IV toxin-antitoxin system n=1 Tax=Lutibacter oceani TaxID=1853311 RepID=A0A3D9RIP5_9FLAO|nr:nucleotidyl transferase AbiEii/AbiGii toxin family protein [Lutibacter oceani]REE78836.1 hypothetical protein BX611_2971 [Lutibacter oceani]
MENKIINISLVAQVAEALKELKDQMIFVGGAVISLYTDDPAADEIRPTGDIDMTINLLNFAEWTKMQERLADLGFSPDPNGHAICSYLYKGISVDIMPSEDGPMGQSNKWYIVGFDNLWTTKVENEEIQILSAPCFLATKFEAFRGRGKDYRTSHDFEDIIYVLDNRTTIIDEIKSDNKEITTFLKQEFEILYKHVSFLEIISSQIHPILVEERLPLVIEKIEQIIAI